MRELPGQASSASPGFGSNTGSANEAVLDLQRQVNDLRSDLLDERETRIDRRQQASGTALAVLGALIGIGGLWACAKFRAIAREARIGGAAARALSTAFPGQAPRIPRAALEFDAGALSGYPGLPVQPGREPAILPSADVTGNGLAGIPRVGNGDGLGPANEAGHVSPSPLRQSPDRGSSPEEEDADRERHEDAIADCTEAIRLDPRNPRLYLERAGLRSELDRHEEAIRDFDRAIRLDPDLVAAYLGRCHAKSALGLHEEAVEDYDQLVRLDPDSAAAVAEG